MAHLAHYREAHPLPMRITHWINLSCMVLLIFSGFLIHFPFWAALTGVARGVHVFCGLVLLFNCIVRYVLAFLVTSAPTGGTRNRVRDYKTWMPQDEQQASAYPLDQVLLVHEEGSSAFRKAWCSSEDLVLCHRHPDPYHGLHGSLPVGTHLRVDLLRSWYRFCWWRDVYAHHPLLHDVRIHHLHHAACIPRIHRGYC